MYSKQNSAYVVLICRVQNRDNVTGATTSIIVIFAMMTSYQYLVNIQKIVRFKGSHAFLHAPWIIRGLHHPFQSDQNLIQIELNLNI